MNKILDAAYWNERWKEGQTGWDLGEASPPLVHYFETHVADKKASILIPGCGNAWEARWLLDHGYHNITLTDVSEQLCDSLRTRYADAPGVQVICGDFFALQGPFDLVVEQTFFCALHPDLRSAYAQKMAELIKPGGKLAGVWFNVLFPFEGPPFGGQAEAYRPLFAPYFEAALDTPCLHSAAPRKDNEWFFEWVRK